MMRIPSLATLLALLGTPTALAAADRPVRVVTLSAVLTEIVSTIGGDAVDVDPLIPAAMDLHSFDPSPQDIRRCVDADLVVASGFSLEPYLERMVRNAGMRGRMVIAAEALRNPVRAAAAPGDVEHDHDHAHDHHDDHDHEGQEEHADAIDPHWWHSPAAVRDVSRHLARELTAARPTAGAEIQLRLDRWLAALDALDSWARTEVARLPQERRVLVTSHHAFGWLARDLGFTVHPIKGISADAEPSGRQLAELVEFVRTRDVRAVFAENVENPRLLSALAREAGVRLGGTLYADGPSAPGSGADTYEAMYRHNVSTIIEALAAP